MRIARGIQNKVLEAMAMARPVVVTRDALEGIDGAARRREVLLADDGRSLRRRLPAAARPESRGDRAGRPRSACCADYVWAERLRGFDRLLAPAERPDRSLGQSARETIRAKSLTWDPTPSGWSRSGGRWRTARAGSAACSPTGAPGMSFIDGYLDETRPPSARTPPMRGP